MTDNRLWFGRILTSCLIIAATLSCGCWWQRDAYTQRMRQQMSRFEQDAVYDRFLGPAFEQGGEFPMWIRPPKATTLRALPKELEGVALGLFQSDGSAALIEFVAMGSSGTETLGDFEQKSFAAMEKGGKGPGVELNRQAAAAIRTMHGSDMSFDVFSNGAARQAGSGTPVNYQWVYYFTEEGSQKVMLAFIIPDSSYATFSETMVKCLESLALGSKVAAARSGVTAGPSSAPSGSTPGGQSGASNF